MTELAEQDYPSISKQSFVHVAPTVLAFTVGPTTPVFPLKPYYALHELYP